MAENLQKRPKKGILKNSSSFDRQDVHSNNAKKSKPKEKETKWDEMNIIATLHPADKDYGHIKIDEPKTPYNFISPEDFDALDAKELAERIRLAAEQPPKCAEDQSESDDEEEDDEADLTVEEKLRRQKFRLRRKQHYNEYYAVKLAKKLMEEEEDEEEDDNMRSAGEVPKSFDGAEYSGGEHKHRDNFENS